MRNKEPVANMKLLLLFLLAGACHTYMPIAERIWVKFKNVKDPVYNSSLLHQEPNIIHAKEILIEERVNKLSQMIEKSLTDFHACMKQYTTGLDKENKKSYYKR